MLPCPGKNKSEPADIVVNLAEDRFPQAMHCLEQTVTRLYFERGATPCRAGSKKQIKRGMR
jgi:hypothetical protein